MVSEKSLRDDTMSEDILSVSEVSYGKIIIDGDHSEIETSLTIDSDNPETVSIDTLLVRENEKWKVDYHQTMDAIGTGEQLSQILRELKKLW